MPVLTCGHGRLDGEQLGSLLADAGVECLIDVRRFPGSRRNAAAASGAIEALTTGLGISYRWDSRLGGRRRLSAADDAASPDSWWKVAAFRAYAGWTRSEECRAGLLDLVAAAQGNRTAIMCSEAVWWRCHRRLISDVLVLEHELPVQHLMHDGRLTEHRPSDGARVGSDGRVLWDAV
ncbi:DUF488 domain-containing protein [Ruania halotolerans]|uniref:DUF488 domain-containing protein n=1 Tax=Ruania halotolerans TaxID=2897773 RepID=UPI001E46D6A5|nr:DUF488 domain-containing protein [Ruania halotolerans]UFU05572.1 DUF488 domain-containing protein [Ruania halotolerans]